MHQERLKKHVSTTNNVYLSTFIEVGMKKLDSKKGKAEASPCRMVIYDYVENMHFHESTVHHQGAQLSSPCLHIKTSLY